MPQVRHRNVGAIAFKESINPKPALLAAHEHEHEHEHQD